MVADERWYFMKEKLQRFMWGRYGNDRFNQFLMIVALVCLALSFFGLRIFYVLALALLVYVYYRMFSRNISKRSSENYAYLQKTERIRAWFDKMKRRIVQSRDYHIYKCPSCGQKIRVPRGKGKICITCPKCRKEFEKRS